MSKIFGGGDNKGVQQQIEQQKVETDRMRAQAEEERRDLNEKIAASGKARRRSGARALLAESRLNPEDGINDMLGNKQTLG